MHHEPFSFLWGRVCVRMGVKLAHGGDTENINQEHVPGHAQQIFFPLLPNCGVAPESPIGETPTALPTAAFMVGCGHGNGGLILGLPSSSLYLYPPAPSLYSLYLGLGLLG